MKLNWLYIRDKLKLKNKTEAAEYFGVTNKSFTNYTNEKFFTIHQEKIVNECVKKGLNTNKIFCK